MLALLGDHEVQDGNADSSVWLDMSVFPNMQHSVRSSGFDELCPHMLKGHTVFSVM